MDYVPYRVFNCLIDVQCIIIIAVKLTHLSRYLSDKFRLLSATNGWTFQICKLQAEYEHAYSSKIIYMYMYVQEKMNAVRNAKKVELLHIYDMALRQNKMEIYKSI